MRRERKSQTTSSARLRDGMKKKGGKKEEINLRGATTQMIVVVVLDVLFSLSPFPSILRHLGASHPRAGASARR
jgi:hypothetical protein